MIGGHGHVTPRPDGAKARCGGPGLCPECSRELAAGAPRSNPRTRHSATRSWADQEAAPPPEEITRLLQSDLEALAAAADPPQVLVGHIELRVEQSPDWASRAVTVTATAEAAPRDEPAAKAPYRPKVLVDFDGVIHRYSRGWADGTAYDPPMAGASESLAELAGRGYEVVIFSTRDGNQIADWLERWGFPPYRITNVKEPAVAMIDDRAIRFIDWDQATGDLLRWYPVRRG